MSSHCSAFCPIFTLYLDEFLKVYEMLIGEMPNPCQSYTAVPVKKKIGL